MSKFYKEQFFSIYVIWSTYEKKKKKKERSFKNFFFYYYYTRLPYDHIPHDQFCPYFTIIGHGIARDEMGVRNKIIPKEKMIISVHIANCPTVEMILTLNF